jgi:hypothetical protein
LGFVALNPTYILPVLLRNAKPNNGRFRNRAPKVSISIKLAAFQASGAARMKLHNNRCHFQEISHRRERGVRREYLKFSFSAFSAFSAVKCYVSFSIRPAVFLAGGWADTFGF